MEKEKYISFWRKYLPVIRIQLKKSLQQDAVLHLDKIELEATGKRELSGYGFNLEIKNGKVVNDISGTAVARDLFKVLLKDPIVKDFLQGKKVRLSMGKTLNLKLSSNLS